MESGSTPLLSSAAATAAPKRKKPRPKPFRSSIPCLGYAASFFTLPRWIQTYEPKRFLTADLISGLTVGVMAIPQSIRHVMHT